MLPSLSWRPRFPVSCRRKIIGLAGLFVLAAVIVFSAFAQELHKSIGETDSKALISVSRVLASANPAVSANIIQSAGFTPDNFPPGWAQFPMVRKIETVYLAAEQHTPRQGSSVLAIMAQSLAQQYPAVSDDPAIKPVLASATPVGKPMYANVVQSAKPDPSVQRAILAISRYTEGRDASAATILQFHFNLPPETAYDILRTSSSNAEALARGLAQVPEIQRTASLERVVAHLDATYRSTATRERDLDPYRPTKSHPAFLANVRDEHSDGAHAPSVGPNNDLGGPSDPKHGSGNMPPTPPSSGGPGNVGGPPPTGSNGGGGGGGVGAPPVEFQTRPQEAYTERVPQWYGSAPVEFVEMVAVEGGAGGVVFGNRFQTRISKQLIAVEYLALSDQEGQLLFHFADKTQASYGPVRPDDVDAAYSMIYSDGKESPVFHEGAGVPLLGIESKEDHYDIVDNAVEEDGTRWTVVAHPSLAHVELGRSVLMADVLPIGGEDSRPSLEELMHKAGISSFDGIYQAMPTDVTNWKFTDAPLMFTLEGDQIVAKNTLQPDGVDCFISAQEFRNGEVKFDPTLVEKFNRFAPRLTAISEDYKRLSDFVPVFDLFRWVKMQKVPVLQSAPGTVDQNKQTIPTWVVLDNNNGITLVFDDSMQTPLEVLQSKINGQLIHFHDTAPEPMQLGLIGVEQKWLARLAAEQAVEREEMRFRRADNQFYRLHEQLSTALAGSANSKRSAIEDARDRLEESLDQAARSNSEAEIEEQKKSYHEGNAVLIELEASALPSQRDQIAQMRKIAESHAWNMVPLMNAVKTTTLKESGILDLSQDLLPALAPETRAAVEADKLSLGQTLDAYSATKLKYEQAGDDLDDLSEKIENHFEHAAPTTKRRFETLAEDPDSQEFQKFLSTTAPVLAASWRKAVANVKQLESQLAQHSEAAEQAESQLEKAIASVFPDFVQWAKLLTSVQSVHN